MRFARYIFIICFIAINNFAFANHLQISDNQDDEKIYQKFIEMDKILKELVNRGVKSMLPYAMQAREHLNLSSSCTSDAFRLFSEIRKLKLSALRILDAVGKLHAGFFSGNIQMIGDFDECMSTSLLDKDGRLALQGQYCLINLKPFMPKKTKILTMDSGFDGLVEATRNATEFLRFFTSRLHMFHDYPIKFGMCVPSGCSAEDVSRLFNYFGENVLLNASVEHCYQQTRTPVFVGKILAITSFSMIGLLVLIGSFLDYYSRKKSITLKSTVTKILQSFSILINFPKVISTNISDKSLSSLIGIRALSMFYVVLIHQYLIIGMFLTAGHLLKIQDDVRSFFFQIILNGILTTDVFFFIGGFLNCYTRNKMHHTGKEASILTNIFHRLLRIYPGYIFSLLAVFLLSTQGPVGNLADRISSKNCEKHWWQNILFINNYFHQVDTCMVHTWYIAVDMQLFIISLFTVPVLFRNSKRGLIINTAILIFGIAGSVLLSWYRNIQPSAIYYRYEYDELLRSWDSYTNILPHIAPYYTGILTGYMLSMKKDFKIPVIYRVAGHFIAATCFTSMLFITKIWNSGTEYTRVESALYVAFSRVVYVSAIALLVVCCSKGYGGIVNHILSLKIWIPISRISFMIYLISFPIQEFYLTNSRMIVDYQRMVTIWRYMGDLTISGLLALAMVVIIESPFITMENVLFHPKSIAGDANPEKGVENQSYVKEETATTQDEMEENFKNGQMKHFN